MEPNSRLESLPSEILADVGSYLDGEDIGRLKLIGSKLLWWKFCKTRPLERIHFPRRDLPITSIPAYLRELSGVEELVISNISDHEMKSCRIRATDMPKKLRKLQILDVKVNMQDFCFGCNNRLLKPTKCMPNLTDLSMMFDWCHKEAWMSLLPKTLQHLALNTWCPSASLPEALLSFSYAFLADPAEQSFKFPPHLMRLVCGHGETSISQLVAALPSSLTSFDVHVIGPAFTLDHVRSLPRGIKILNISLWALMNPNAPDEDYATAWPPSLEHLTMGGLPFQKWKTLPRSLSEFHHAPMSTRINSQQAAAHTSAFQSCWLDLPPNLRALSVNMGGPYAMPKKLPHFTCLTSLFLPSAFFYDPSSLDTLSNLWPPTLTEMDIQHLNAHTAKFLPQSLLLLTVATASLSPTLYYLLPHSLVEITLSQLRDTNYVFDPSKRESELWADSKHLVPPESPLDPTLPTTPSFSSFLRKLTLSGHDLGDDTFLQNLPKNLIFLEIGTGRFTDAGLASLGACPLETIEIRSERRFTSACFVHLPSTLTSLTLSRTDVQTSHIQHLPRNLIKLSLVGAQDMSIAALEDLPRRLNLLELPENKTILPEHRSLLPFKFGLKSGMSAFFSNAVFLLWDGVVLEGGALR